MEYYYLLDYTPKADWSPVLSAFYLTFACLLWEWVACGNSLLACVFIMYHVLYTMFYFPFVRCFSPCMWKFLSPPIGPLVFPGPLFMNQREQVLARIRPLQAFKLMRERLKGTAVFTTDSTWSPIMPFFPSSFNKLYSSAFFGPNNISLPASIPLPVWWKNKYLTLLPLFSS